jgi:hypothetical protein
MEKEILKLLTDMNQDYYYQSKNYPDKSKRKMFLYYCSAITSAKIRIEKLIENK